MSLAFIVLLVIFFGGAFLIRIPIGFAMVSGGVVYLLMTGRDLGQAAQLISGGFYSKFVLLAVPLFIFGAQVMNSSAVTNRIFHFAHGLVGKWHGGLAQVNVVNSVIFSGMSGSAVADASGAGLMEIKAMTDGGYPKAFACATTAATSTIGPIIPPSIPMVLYANLSGASVGMLFAGGMIPGFFLAAAQMVLIRFMAVRRGFPRSERPPFAEQVGRFIASFPALLTPVVLLGGIYTGIFTPTEAAAVASFYALILAFFVYRSMDARRFWAVFVEVARQTGSISVLLAGSFLVNFAVASEGIPRQLADLVLGVTESRILLLLLIMVAFLVMGMFLETLVLLLIMTPIVLPVLTAAGVDLVHFGVIITLNMMIGLSTPPMGLILFILNNLTGTPLKDIIREIWPFLGLMVTVLFILTFTPDVILWVPRLLGYQG